MNKTSAILLAAGKSERFGNITTKPFLLLNEKPVYRYSLDILLAHPQIKEVILVIPKNMLLHVNEKLRSEKFPKPIQIIAGGKTRFESVKNALDYLDKTLKTVLIHDAARPFIIKELIDRCLEKISQNKAVSCAIESADTLVFGTTKDYANSFPERNKLLRIQTPQVFDLDVLKTAYSLALKEGKSDFTDDSSLIYYYNLAPVYLVSGSEQNLKITAPVDLLLAEHILNGLKS